MKWVKEVEENLLPKTKPIHRPDEFSFNVKK